MRAFPLPPAGTFPRKRGKGLIGGAHFPFPRLRGKVPEGRKGAILATLSAWQASISPCETPHR